MASLLKEKMSYFYQVQWWIIIGRNGISLTRCPENPRINHCNITYNAKAGVYVIACDDVVISANQFEENQDALQFIDGYNLTMSGNKIDEHLRYGVVVENTEQMKLGRDGGTGVILQGTSTLQSQVTFPKDCLVRR